jgi:protocatechuate 3,4-dioxygenase beta subunit
MQDEKQHSSALSRRRFMISLAGTGMASLLTGCDVHRSDTGRSAHAAFPAAVNALSVCVLTPASIEGPFYIDGALVRNDIREDRIGQDVRLRLQVVDVNSGCNPIQNAVVDIWHCDAGGLYSGYPDAAPDGMPGGPGGFPGSNPPPFNVPPPAGGMPERNMHVHPTNPTRRFLRGVQVTNHEGLVEFRTIYPGWYAGRTVHIHLKAYLNTKEMITTQLYFPEELNDRMFTTVDPYTKRGVSPTTNANDMIAGAHPSVLTITEGEALLTGSFIIGIKRA